MICTAGLKIAAFIRDVSDEYMWNIVCEPRSTIEN